MKNYFDNLNRIINSYNSGKKISFCNYSKITLIILGILFEFNLLENYFLLKFKNRIYIIVLVKKIRFLKFISKPSRKIYIKNRLIRNYTLNMGLTLLSTNLGILTINECKKIEISGCLLLTIL